MWAMHTITIAGSVVYTTKNGKPGTVRRLTLSASFGRGHGAPAFGVASTHFFRLPGAVMGTALALFAGFFLYIGASDLIPESYHAHPKFLTTAMTLVGAALLYFAIALVR